MSGAVGQREIQTQKRVVEFFQAALGYASLGHWKHREGNANVEQALLTDWLKRQGHGEKIISKVLFELDKAAALGGSKTLLTFIAGLAATPEDERPYRREAAGSRSCFLLVALTPFTNMTCRIASYPGLPPLRANAKTALGALAPRGIAIRYPPPPVVWIVEQRR